MPAERSITTVVREVKEGNALASVGKDMRELANEVERTDDKFKLFTKDMEKVNADISKSTARVKELRAQISRTGDTGLFGDLRKEETRLRSLQNLAKNLEKDAREAGSIIGATITNSISEQLSGAFSGGGGGGGMAAIGGAVGGLLTAAVAPLGAAIAGAVVGAVGTGGVIGGVLAASHDPRVKSAFVGLADDAKSEFFKTGDAFVEPTLASVKILDTALKDLHLDKVFAQAAPDVEIIATGIASMAHNLEPGLNKALERSGPFANEAALGMSRLGAATSQFLDNISASPGAVEGLAFLFDFIEANIEGLGRGLEFLSDLFHGFNAAGATAFDAIDAGLRKVGVDSGPIHDLAVELDRMINNSEHGRTAHQAFGNAAEVAASEQDRLNKELEEFNNLVDDLIGNSLNVDRAQLSLREGFKAFSDSLAENGNAWGTNTQAAFANEDALQAVLDRANQVRLAEIKSGDVAADVANNEYEQNIKQLLAMASAAGISKDALEALAKKYLVQVDIASNLPAIGQAIAAQFSGALANGGGLATGGPAYPGMSYRVGESGMERLDMHPGGGATVTPLGPRSGGGAMSLSVSVERTGDQLLDTLLRMLVFRVNGNGGLGASGFSN